VFANPPPRKEGSQPTIPPQFGDRRGHLLPCQSTKLGRKAVVVMIALKSIATKQVIFFASKEVEIVPDTIAIAGVNEAVYQEP
jgi:hypothetical protein